MTPSAIFRVFIQRPGRGAGRRFAGTGRRTATAQPSQPEHQKNQPQLLKRSGKRESDGRAQEGPSRALPAGWQKRPRRSCPPSRRRRRSPSGSRLPRKQHLDYPEKVQRKRKVTATIKPINQGF
jgi:hypothetical protein